jgi:hypothetical protein
MSGRHTKNKSTPVMYVAHTCRWIVLAQYLRVLLCLSPLQKFHRYNLNGMAFLIRYYKPSQVTWSLSAVKNVDYLNVCYYFCVNKLPLFDFHPTGFSVIFCAYLSNDNLIRLQNHVDEDLLFVARFGV